MAALANDDLTDWDALNSFRQYVGKLSGHLIFQCLCGDAHSAHGCSSVVFTTHWLARVSGIIGGIS